MEKEYYLVHLFFGDKSEGNHYIVYSYQKSRRFTAKQAWNHIWNEKNKTVIATNKLPVNATIDDYWKIVESLNLNEKLCDQYCTMGFIS